AALTAQVLIREQRLTRKHAIEVVKEAAGRMSSGPVAIRDGRRIEGSEEKLRLGELLIGAGLVSEIDLISAVERAIVAEQPIGQILIQAGLIDQHTLSLTLDLQSKVNTRALAPNEGIRLLKEAPPVQPAPPSSDDMPAQPQRSREE